jgi:hypothetical protein
MTNLHVLAVVAAHFPDHEPGLEQSLRATGSACPLLLLQSHANSLCARVAGNGFLNWQEQSQEPKNGPYHP